MAITNQWNHPLQNAYNNGNGYDCYSNSAIDASRYAQYTKTPMTNLDKARQQYDLASVEYRRAEQAYYAAKAGEPAFCPTKNEINANPALKNAYDEFMIIYKLQKGSK